MTQPTYVWRASFKRTVRTKLDDGFESNEIISNKEGHTLGSTGQEVIKGLMSKYSSLGDLIYLELHRADA